MLLLLYLSVNQVGECRGLVLFFFYIIEFTCYCLTFFSVDGKVATVCENKLLTAACPAGRVIKITYALFGRAKANMKTCFNKSLLAKRVAIEKFKCSSKEGIPRVRKICNGRRKCIVPAITGIFGDPCKGIFKYLRVRYICQKGII